MQFYKRIRSLLSLDGILINQRQKIIKDQMPLLKKEGASDEREFYLKLSFEHEQKKDHFLALHFCRLALWINPSNAEVVQRYGLILIHLQEYKQAERHFYNLIKERKDSDQFYNNFNLYIKCLINQRKYLLAKQKIQEHKINAQCFKSEKEGLNFYMNLLKIQRRLSSEQQLTETMDEMFKNIKNKKIPPKYFIELFILKAKNNEFHDCQKIADKLVSKHRRNSFGYFLQSVCSQLRQKDPEIGQKILMSLKMTAQSEIYFYYFYLLYLCQALQTQNGNLTERTKEKIGNSTTEVLSNQQVIEKFRSQDFSDLKKKYDLQIFNNMPFVSVMKHIELIRVLIKRDDVRQTPLVKKYCASIQQNFHKYHVLENEQTIYQLHQTYRQMIHNQTIRS